MSKVFIKCTRALNKVSQVEAHCKYVGFRSKEKNEKGFFGRDTDKADYKDFIKRIENNPALKHTRSIKAQKLIFSLWKGDYDALKRSGLDYKHMVRNTLRAYEVKHNVKLDWIANIHEKDNHPHVHVVIKGVSDTKDDNGRYKRIKFDMKTDFKEMKKDFDLELEKHAIYMDYEKFNLTKTLNDVSRGFEQVSRAIAKDAEREQLRAEIQRTKNSTLYKEGEDFNIRRDKGKGKDR